jgi:hypothetical protein
VTNATESASEANHTGSSVESNDTGTSPDSSDPKPAPEANDAEPSPTTKDMFTEFWSLLPEPLTRVTEPTTGQTLTRGQTSMLVDNVALREAIKHFFTLSAAKLKVRGSLLRCQGPLVWLGRSGGGVGGGGIGRC